MNQIEMEKAIKSVDDLFIGNTFKNFPELCKFLDMPIIASGASKVKFLELLDENFEIERKGHKFIIGKRKIMEKKDFGFDKDAEPYKAMGRLFYNYLDSMGINKVHYITNSELAMYFNLINETHKTFASAVPWECEQFKRAMNSLIDTDYGVVINELVRDKVRSFAKRDVYNSIQEVWMAEGKELTNPELIQMLKDKKNWMINKYGVLIDDESRKTLKTLQPLAWGTRPEGLLYGYKPKDAEKKAMIAVNEDREKNDLPRYYKVWKIVYVFNPYKIELNNEWEILIDKRIQLVDNRMKWDQYTDIWEDIYGFVRQVWIDWINNVVKIEPDKDNVLRITGVDHNKWMDLVNKVNESIKK